VSASMVAVKKGNELLEKPRTFGALRIDYIKTEGRGRFADLAKQEARKNKMREKRFHKGKERVFGQRGEKKKKRRSGGVSQGTRKGPRGE